ncbi:MAG: hypothetical protein SPE33_07180 [[Pasteurella] aerogenes]|nr:hypothetical protein [[Pasteurella] aerogenes]MDY4595423.1 hypothetical protein [[Pasteurella] aerogenes]
MKTLAKTFTLALFAGIVSTNVMAAQPSDDDYATYANQLKVNLTALQQTQDLTQFQRLVNESLDLAVNAKNTVSQTFINRMDASDNAMEQNRIDYQEWKLVKLINSLEAASNKASLTSAKDSVLFDLASAI